MQLMTQQLVVYQKAAADLKYEVADVIFSFKVVGVTAGCINPNPDPDPNPGAKSKSLI